MNNIESVVLFQIERTSKVSKIYSQREFDRLQFGITIEQWILLKIIQENGPLSQKALSDFSLRDPASITRTVDILEKKQFLYREAIPGNRRQYNILLSDKGRDFVKEKLPIIERHRKLSLSGFDEKEMQTLSSYLKRIQNNMR